MLSKILGVMVCILIIGALILFTLIIISVNKTDAYWEDRLITTLGLSLMMLGFISFILSVIVKAQNEN